MIRIVFITYLIMLMAPVIAAIPEDIIKVEIPDNKVRKKKPLHLLIHAMQMDTIEVSIKNFEKKIKYKNNYTIPQDSTIDIVLPLKDLKMGIYFLDVKKDSNTLVEAYTVIVSFLRNKIIKGQ